MKLSDINLDKFLPEAPTSEPVPSGAGAVEAIAKRAKFLTADGQTATPLEQEAVFDGNDLLDVNFLDRCLLARKCIGRIRVVGDGARGWATGFLVAPGLVMTNNHVFANAATVGVSTISFDFYFDVGGQRPATTEDFEFRPDLFFVTSPSLDYTLVAVAEASSSGSPIRERRFIRMIPESGKAKEGEYVTIFQHPEGLPMQIALRENKVIRADPSDAFIWYRADTAHGSSGSPVLNNSLQLVALHASGRIKRDQNGHYMLVGGGTTDSLKGLTETDVLWEANTGYRISRIVDDVLAQTKVHWPQHLPKIEAALRAGDVMSTAIAPTDGREASVSHRPSSHEQEVFIGGTEMPNRTTASGAISLTSGELVIPLQLRISLEAGSPSESISKSKPANSALEVEAFKMRMPIIYDGLETRDGFKKRLLDDTRDVPSPIITDLGQTVVPTLLDGSGKELEYAHFSVWMHKERRLALYTAANVDWRNRRKTVGGRSTSRDSLAGWPGEDNIAELWTSDPRIDERYQLPDGFYTNDRGAFDKGHITRRDDVCWGDTFEEIQTANGDTFHVTNCSPQRKAFNQGSFGQENWGDLETAIQTLTKADGQPACIFAGPVLRPDDPWFNGSDDVGAVRIRIPREFWKIVVVKGAADFEVFSFLLKQEVRDVTEQEFRVTDEWLASFKPVGEIQALTRGWLDFSELAPYDQHGNRGV